MSRGHLGSHPRQPRHRGPVAVFRTPGRPTPGEHGVDRLFASLAGVLECGKTERQPKQLVTLLLLDLVQIPLLQRDEEVGTLDVEKAALASQNAEAIQQVGAELVHGETKWVVFIELLVGAKGGRHVGERLHARVPLRSFTGQSEPRVEGRRLERYAAVHERAGDGDGGGEPGPRRACAVPVAGRRNHDQRNVGPVREPLGHVLHLAVPDGFHHLGRQLRASRKREARGSERTVDGNQPLRGIGGLCHTLLKDVVALGLNLLDESPYGELRR